MFLRIVCYYVLVKKYLTITSLVLIILGTIFLNFFYISKMSFAKNLETTTLETPKTPESFFSYLKNITKELSTNRQTLVKEVVLENSIRVPILVYHGMRPLRPNDGDLVKMFNTEPQVFEKQMQYLKDNNYSVISFNDLYEALNSGKKLSEKSVILSFDDGSQSQYDYAFPVLKKFNFTATFFIFTSAPGHKYFLTWDEIKELDAAGMTIGSHTLNHPYLDKITDPKELEKQIIYGKTSLEKHMGKIVDFFAYPFGEYNDQIIEVVKKSGFKMARSIHIGRYHTIADLYTLKGILINSDYKRFVRELEKTTK